MVYFDAKSASIIMATGVLLIGGGMIWLLF